MFTFNTAAVLATLALAGSAAASPLTITKRANGVLINPSGDTQFCLATSAAPGNGVAPQFMLCSATQTVNPNAANYPLWDIAPGNNPNGIQLTGTNYCLDAGENPDSISGPPAPLKIWQCYPGLQQQVWYYTDDLHIAVTGSKPCISFGRYGTFLDVCSSQTNAGAQTFITTVNGGSAPVTTTTTSSAPSTTTTTTPSNGGTHKIHPNTDNSLCLEVLDRKFVNGQPVHLRACSGSSTDPSQAWTINRGQGSVSVMNGQFCLDFGTGGGSNGTPMKIWQCYPGLFQQTLYYTDSPDNHIAVVGGNQCLDVERGTFNVQSWQCSGTDTQQLWTISSQSKRSCEEMIGCG